MGKRTTTRHKEDNTFRFETFEEKLKNISVNVNLSIRDGRTDLPEDNTTFFFQEIEKWVDLNRTESFGELLTHIGDDIQSLPQVLLQKDRLAQVFLTHLDNPDNQASYEPAFALLVALARDLGQEIYPHFSKFFKSIIAIAISSKNSEIIEQGFKCYAYLSKYLRRQIARDLDQHLKLFAPLLNPKLKKYVVIFACEAFEVVVSKYARDHPTKFLDLVFNILLKNTPENATGVGTLLFAMFKGVGGSIKIQSSGFKLSDCVEYSSVIPEENRHSWANMLNVLIQKLLNHGNPSDIQALFKCFEALMIPIEGKHISLIFPVYKVMLEYESCQKVPDVYACVSVLKILTETLITSNLEELAETIVSLIELKGKTTNPEILASLKPIVIQLLDHVDLEWIKKIDTALQDTSNYFYFYLIPIVKAYERIHVSEDKEINPLDNQTLRCISEAVIRQNGFYHMLNKEEHFFTGFSTPLWFYGTQKRLIRPLNMTNLSKENFDCCSVISYAEESLKSAFNIDTLARLFLSYSRMSTKECSGCYKTCLKVANLIISHHETCEATKEPALSMLLFLVLETLIMHGPADPWMVFKELEILKYLKNVEDVIVGAASSANPFSLWSLKCVDLIVHNAKLAETGELRQGVVDFLNGMTEGLTSNLQSGFKIVRSLTLSVVRNVTLIGKSETGKLSQMYDKFLEIENTSLLNPKFASLAKSVLIECKVLIESDTTSEDIKKICLKYSLGLLYSNFNLIWGVCVEAIMLAGRHMQFATFWSIFSKHFLMHFPEPSYGAPRLNVLERQSEDNANEFLAELEALVFGFPQAVSVSLGLEETLDISQYRVNLWRSMVTLPIGKPEFNELKTVIDKTITRTFDNQSTERGLSGEINRTLVPMFEFLEKCDHASADLDLWEKSLEHLISMPDVQKACWEFLHAKRKNKLKNYKVDVDELIKSDSMDCVHKFRIDAIDTTQNEQYQNVSVEKRRLLMDIVIRILIGKERKWKADKRLQVLRFMGGCTEADARKYLELTVGPALKDDRMSPKVIEVKINKIANAIRAWRYKFPNLLDELLNVVCDLTVGISNLKKPFPRHSDEEELPDSVFEDQKKGAVKAGRTCIVGFFTFLSKFNLEENTLERIFDVFIWTGIDEMKCHTGSNISWIMRLFHVWSSHERFHSLLAKCREGNTSNSGMQGIFDLLASNVAQFEVRSYVLEILLNLAAPSEMDIDGKLEDIENEEDVKLEHSEKMDGRAVVCKGTHVFGTSESIGMNIVLFGKAVILNLFQNVPLFKRFVSQPEGDRCLDLISKLALFVDEGEAAGKLCLIVIEMFAMYKHSEENLFPCLVACKNLLTKSTNTKALCLKLAQAFTWVSGRRLRVALCDILSAQNDTFLFENIRDLNAWTDLAVDTPDFSKRHKAFQNILKAIQEERFNQVLFTLAATNCFNGLLNETDIGMRNSSKNMLIKISESLKNMTDLSDVEKGEIRVFLDSVIIPRIRGGICHKEENRFSDFLQVFISFITNGQELHGTFKELDKVITPAIIEGLQDLQIHLRTRAMNKLSLKIAEVGKDVSATILKTFVLPLANHNLLDEDKLGKNINELIDSSIEVLRTILTLFPHEHYFKYLTTVVDNPKRNTSLAKQYERILVATMDAFHFDLSLATSDRLPQKVETEKVVETEVTEVTGENTEGIDEDLEVTEDEETIEDVKEKVVIPIVLELTVLPKAAAIKCLKILKVGVIPKLRKYLNFEEKATHKLSRADKSVDNDVILKIPCTIALVKLLKKIPKSEGQNAIRSIIPSLCAGLRNNLISVRNTLRKTLLNVIKELGIWNFRTVIGYLKSTLLRGYQKHILNYTVGYLMKCLESELKKNPDQLPIKEILPLCEDELYGIMQEEKDLAAIKQKTREAARNNAHPILKLCAKCMQSKSNLRILIEPAVKQLTAKRTPKVAKTTRQWLDSISDGLADNVVIDHLELIDWLKEVMEKESLDDTSVTKSKAPETKKRKLLVETKDAYLIEDTKKKPTADGKITGQFLLTEFSFNCLYNGLNKSNRLRNALVEGNSVDVLNSFVKKLGEGIQSSSKQVNIVSLRCLTLLFEFDLSSFKDLEMVDGIRRSGFIAMSNHCYRTTSDATMTNATFKFLTGFFLRFPEYKINIQDFELMLKCIQSFLTNGDCSSAAITLLKGVLRNKFKSSHLPELMEEVFKQSIQSYYQHINEGCRQAYFVYLSNYCTAPKELSVQVQMILNQFDYSEQNGRLTAVEIMNSLVDSMPQKSFQEVKELIFLKTFATLDKELQPSVREKLCEVMKTLFRHEEKKSLVRMFLKLMNLDKHIPERDTFFLIAGGLIQDQNVFPAEEFIQLLYKIEEVLNPDKLEDLCNKSDDMDQQAQDYAVYQALVCLKKGILRKIGGVSLWSNSSPVSKTMREIFTHLRNTHLLYEHEWVPVITLDIFTGIFSAMKITGEEMKAICAESIESGDTNNTLLISTDDLSNFLKNIVSVIKFSERADVQKKAAVILTQLSNVAAQLSDLAIFVETVGEIKRAVNHEVVKDSKVVKVRMLAFDIFLGMVAGSPLKSVKEIAEGITRVAVRELTDDGVPASLKVEAEKLTTALRDMLGNAEFNHLYAEVNDFYHRKRNENRAKKKEQVVLHPGLVRKRTKKVFDSSTPFKKKKFNKK